MIGLGRICSCYSGICRLIFRVNWKIGCRRLSLGSCRSIRRGWDLRRRSRRIWIWGKGLWRRSRWVRRWKIRPSMIPWMLLSGMSSSRRKKVSGPFIGPWRTSLETWWLSCKLKVVVGKSRRQMWGLRSGGCSKISGKNTISTKIIRVS